MAQFLHIRVEDIDLLVPALHVHEVVDLDHKNDPGDRHALWRNQVITQLDLAFLLQRPNTGFTRKYGVVYSPQLLDEEPVLMRIDHVLGLRNPKPEQLHPLPSISTIAHKIFDAIWIDSRLNQKGYCLKSQLPSDFMV